MYEHDQEGEEGLVDKVGCARKKGDNVSMVEVARWGGMGMSLMQMVGYRGASAGHWS